MRQDDGHIGVPEGVILLFAVFASMLYLQYPAYLVEEGGPAAWEVALVVTLLSVAAFWPLAKLVARFPGKRLAAIGDEVVGPWLSRLVNFSVAAWLLFASAVTLRNYTETFIASLLPSTPPSVLMAVGMLVVVYTAHRGLEPLARVTQMLFPLIIAGSLLILIASLPQSDASFLFPILGHGPLTTLWGGVYYTGMSAELILLLVAGSSFRSPSAVRQVGFWSLLLFGASSILTAAVLVMVFGAPDAARLALPLYNLARVVHLGRFFQRFEALAVMLWFYAACARLAALMWGTAVSLTDTLGLPHYRPLLWPVGVMVMALAFLPKDFMTVFRLERDLMRPLGWVMNAIPVVLWLVALARGKGGESNAA